MTLSQRLLDALWYVHPEEIVSVRAAPVECLAALVLAAKPSQQRLHLRGLFTEGRRYHLQPAADGFKLTSSRRMPRRRGRTAAAALVTGAFTAAGEGATRLTLRARMHWPYFLDIFLIPSLIVSIMVFMPWPTWLITLLALMLYGLSWAWHRLTAAMQAAEMLYFVRKALEDLSPFQTPALNAAAPDVVAVDFREEWERFFYQRKNNDGVDETPDDGS